MANETVLVDLGPYRPGMVVRLPPLEPTFPDYDLAPQAVVQNAVAASRGAGARAGRRRHRPDAGSARRSSSCRGCRATSPGRRPVFDPYVRDAGPALQRVMHDGLIDAMADVHAVAGGPTPGGGAAGHAACATRSSAGRAYVEWSSEGDPLPALAQALDWCARHVPAERAAVLLWGDVRLGNLVFDPERRVTAVLDWDLASLGPPRRWTSAGTSGSSS